LAQGAHYRVLAARRLEDAPWPPPGRCDRQSTRGSWPRV